jgi:hypothetical protein
MATASKIGVGSGRLQKFGSAPIAIPSQNFDSTAANPFDFTGCRRLRRSGVALQRISAHSENFVVNDRFVFLDPITPVVKFLTG